MPTYTEAIARLDEKLRDSEAWPSDTSKLAEQLHLLYNAAIAVLKGIPLHRLTLVESAALTDTPIQKSIISFALPGDIFVFRNDFGVSQIRLDGNIYYPVEGLPKESLKSLGENSMHSDRKLFAIDSASREILAQNVTEAKILYFKKPTKPTDGTPAYPLSDDNDYELALSIVAAHVSGETIRDGGQSTFQTFLSQLYGDDVNEQ